MPDLSYPCNILIYKKFIMVLGYHNKGTANADGAAHGAVWSPLVRRRRKSHGGERNIIIQIDKTKTKKKIIQNNKNPPHTPEPKPKHKERED